MPSQLLHLISKKLINKPFQGFCMSSLLFYCIALLIPFFFKTVRSKALQALETIEKFLWGNLSKEELNKFMILATLGTTIMITAWGLKTFKDGVLI